MRHAVCFTPRRMTCYTVSVLRAARLPRGIVASPKSATFKVPCMCSRLPATRSTLEELVRDCDWQRERAEACVAGRASGGELPRAWHLAEQAFQAFVRAVGMLQVSPGLHKVLCLSRRLTSVHPWLVGTPLPARPGQQLLVLLPRDNNP